MRELKVRLEVRDGNRKGRNVIHKKDILGSFAVLGLRFRLKISGVKFIFYKYTKT